MSRRLMLSCIALVVVLVGALAVVGRPDVSPLPRQLDLVSAAEARQQLAELATVPRQPTGLPDYRREAFGARWADVDGNGCHQRDDVLLRDAAPGTAQLAVQGACAHDVLAGTWVDAYTGRTLTFGDLKDPAQAQALQIDHVVPLAEAWRSGASSWSDERREQFANDLRNLLTVDGPTNASKSSDDPAAWKPRKEYQCQYARHWIGVKHAWQLAADPSEVDALEEMLGRCPAPGTPD